MSTSTNILKKLVQLTVTGLLALTLSACSLLPGGGSSDDKDTGAGMTADQIYSSAKSEVQRKNYEKAIKLYESLEARYPLSKYAQAAPLEAAYAYYKFEESDAALDTIDRFARAHPGSEQMAYAWYLRGLVNFNRGSSIVDRVFPRSIADLDTVRQKEAFQDFSRVVTRYGDSKYAADAQARLQYLRNTLAISEVNVAKYYMTRGAWLAAFNRAEYAIKHYQGSPAIIDALEIKVKSARNLGKNDLAADSLSVLQANFPQRAAQLK